MVVDDLGRDLPGLSVLRVKVCVPRSLYSLNAPNCLMSSEFSG